jgi:hypothetical protein
MVICSLTKEASPDKIAFVRPVALVQVVQGRINKARRFVGSKYQVNINLLLVSTVGPGMCV